MHILVLGNERNWDECRQKFGAAHTYYRSASPRALTGAPPDVIFDFMTDSKADYFESYRDHSSIPVFFNSARTSLQRIFENRVPPDYPVFGFPGLPTFLNREILEVSLHRSGDQEKLARICHELNTDFEIVRDSVGMVTPKVICMIINEAFYTLEEGIATRLDIDQAMKLGTGYPLGPFEWCQKIGANEVFEVLLAVQKDTGHPRYAISPLLESECRREE